MARLFFAIIPPRAVRERLAAAQLRLDLVPGAVKWVEQENLHLTLLFIGETPQERLAGLSAAAEKTAGEVTAFTVEIAGLNAFPGRNRPRVIFAGVGRGERELHFLAGRLAFNLGIRPDKPFRAHFTLGRVRDGRQAPPLPEAAPEILVSSVFPVESFYCLESTLTPRGPVYKKRAEFILLQK